ncbi:sulfur carrier protein ThiS [Sphingobacterium shayense]|uniref:sulfur carrier protein ThiS n=1 Tax=Sphingobacterium shayense TaxID=626343 RepID=UPI001552B471|nr:sulfur carrier protein ThiS [Sphingobacterium shayense]NQD72377.1 sulfur carrier protein ThiS [Sphingobacterium shayense]
MHIKLNNQLHEFEAPYPENLEQVLLLLIPNLRSTGIAVALNDHVIPRNHWASTPITTQSEIILITATQGG